MGHTFQHKNSASSALGSVFEWEMSGCAGLKMRWRAPFSPVSRKPAQPAQGGASHALSQEQSPSPLLRVPRSPAQLLRAVSAQKSWVLTVRSSVTALSRPCRQLGLWVGGRGCQGHCSPWRTSGAFLCPSFRKNRTSHRNVGFMGTETHVTNPVSTLGNPGHA